MTMWIMVTREPIMSWTFMKWINQGPWSMLTIWSDHIIKFSEFGIGVKGPLVQILKSQMIIIFHQYGIE
ncbi:MAG: hypothetical protein D4R64_16660 [Porphyromonadaceae bacterium]|nr:MAG: hypothetical protein D4R64_16660 [Porphyromonadaceae bacterium]